MFSKSRKLEDIYLLLLFLKICLIHACNIAGFKYMPPNPGSKIGNSQENEDLSDCRDCLEERDYFENLNFLRFFSTSQSPCCANRISSSKILKNATQCGRFGGASRLRVTSDKVVGGEPVLENQLPWQVAILAQNGVWRGCGAVLISCDPVIVVTAAHCVVVSQLVPALLNPIPWPPSVFKLAFGAHALQKDVLGENEVRMEVEEIIVHPSFVRKTLHAGIGLRTSLNFNMTLFENDIAVMKVKNASTLQCRQDSIWPACLPNKETNYAENNKAIVSGWGRVEGNEQINRTIPRVLRKTEVSIVSDTECSDNWNTPISDKQICAGNLRTGQGACSGDSGGPLVAAAESLEEVWSAVGLVSWGSTSCNEEYYGVFTEIGKYLPWIAEQFGLHSL